MKNTVEVGGDTVRKTFHDARKSVVRFRCETQALRRLAGVDGVPSLLEVQEDERVLVVSRVPGTSLDACAHVPDSCFLSLRRIVGEMLRRGVARHAMPPRDVIVQPDGSAGLVDFERVTLRRWRFSPVWGVACLISRHHLLRVIGNRAAHLLAPAERVQLGLGSGIRRIFRIFLEVRRKFRLAGRPGSGRVRDIHGESGADGTGRT